MMKHGAGIQCRHTVYNVCTVYKHAYLLCMTAIITEPYTKGNGNYEYGSSPSQEVVQYVHLWREEDHYKIDQDVYAFNEHPGKDDQKEVV